MYVLNIDSFVYGVNLNSYVSLALSQVNDLDLSHNGCVLQRNSWNNFFWRLITTNKTLW